MTAVDHVGFNVPDLDQALAFFTSALGCTVIERAGPRPFKGDSATSVRVAMLRYDDHTTIELLEWRVPGQNPYRPTMTDPGGYHLALTVTDVDATVSYLRAISGVQVTDPDQLSGGRRRAFFVTPWGMAMQLITPVVDRVF
jgi:catechol 2,3-dioxygenase-like lactoylglutathione lyase family enzyme